MRDHRDNAPNYVLSVPEGVTLASGRSESSEGGLLYFSRRLENQRYMLSLRPGSRITGLRFRGPTRSTEPVGIKTGAIYVYRVDNVLIDRNEFYDWPGAGVTVHEAANTRPTASRVRVTNNFFHHNLRCGSGYGVVVFGEGGYAYIDRNVFDFNRHAVAADGRRRMGYIADRNFVLSGGKTCSDGWWDPGYYNQHFDMHGLGDRGRGGVAGEYMDIRRNTIRGEQKYYVIRTRPAFHLRGEPEIMAYFRDNVVAHDDRDEAVKKHDNTTRLTVTRNQYDVDTSMELAVGDFDGDGYDDVFQATGGVWVYSARGQSEWRYLNHDARRLSELRFGDFDGNGKTDVFAQDGARWLVSWNATSGWISLPQGSSIDMSKYRFGDFDGDGRTDVFYASGTHWYYSSGGATDWQVLNSSSHTAEDLRFGDFDRDGKTDIFGLSKGGWAVSKGGVSRWELLNERLSANLDELVFADFNGDRRTDIARQHDGDWQVSWSGSSAWRTLHRNAPDGMPIHSLLVGDFDGDGSADALHYERSRVSTLIIYGNRFVISRRGSGELAVRSRHDMR